MTKLSIFHRFYNVFWTLLYNPFWSLQMHSGIETFRRSRNALKPMEKQQKPSNLTFRNDEMLHIHKVLQCRHPEQWVPPGIQILARSPNAIISNEKSPKPSNATPQNDEIINIAKVVLCFLNTAVQPFLVTPNALRNRYVPSFTKCIKTNGKVTATFKSGPSKWRNLAYS